MLIPLIQCNSLILSPTQSQNNFTSTAFFSHATVVTKLTDGYVCSTYMLGGFNLSNYHALTPMIPADIANAITVAQVPIILVPYPLLPSP